MPRECQAEHEVTRAERGGSFLVAPIGDFQVGEDFGVEAKSGRLRGLNSRTDRFEVRPLPW
jgi:hypothetical protein